MAGPAGVGKTRLAREALAAAQQRGVVTRWAVGTASARALPLGAFAATLGVVGPDPARLVRQASEALLAGAGRAGVIIGVDDAHLLDELSAVLVHQLVLRQAASVVLTLRTGESAPDAVTALWKDGHLPRLELDPLSETETAMLVEARLGGPVDSATARRLWSITRVMCCICGSWSMVSWNRDGCIRSPGCGGGRVSWRCRRGWWSWCRPGSGGCRMLSETSWRCWRSVSRWVYHCWWG